MIISNHTRFVNYTMAGNEVGQRIPADGCADGARAGGFVNCMRQPSVTCERAGLDSQQGSPDANLERCAANHRAQSRLRTRTGPPRENFCGEPRGGGIIAF